jgi:hypothetical protein
VIYEEEVVLATVTGSWKDLFSGRKTERGVRTNSWTGIGRDRRSYGIHRARKRSSFKTV